MEQMRSTRSVAMAAVWIALLSLLAALPASSGSGTIIPLYTYPTDASWTSVANGKKAHPSVSVVATINPASGPGTSKSEAYVNGTQFLAQAGVLVLGYVATGWAHKPQAAVKAGIDNYVSWYPAVRGIFLDEMNNTAGQESYYSNVTAYAKSSKGLAYVVGNTGEDPIPSFVGTVDTIVIYENPGLPSISFLGGWHDSYPASNFASISYRVGSLNVTFVQQAVRHVGFVYITNDDAPNPYDTLPPYFDALLAALEVDFGKSYIAL